MKVECSWRQNLNISHDKNSFENNYELFHVEINKDMLICLIKVLQKNANVE